MSKENSQIFYEILNKTLEQIDLQKGIQNV